MAKGVINIHILCPASPVESFGQIGLELARWFERFGQPVNILSTSDRVTPLMDDEVRSIAGRDIIPANGGIYMGFPTEYHKFHTPQGKRLAVTMFETTKIPPDWTTALNDLDAIVTPCEFSREVFQAHGVTTPITVAPLGIDSIYRYVERTSDRPFTFYAQMDRGSRKGGVLALQAFRAAFGDDTDCRLILKARGFLRAINVDHPNVDVIASDVDVAGMYEIYKGCDVAICATRGEGFGLIPRECAATGMITLATAWSGTADHIGMWGIPLPYELVPVPEQKAGSLKGYDLGMWAEPDFDELVDTLVRVARYRDMYRAIAKESAQWVHELYSWERFAATVLRVWNDI